MTYYFFDSPAFAARVWSPDNEPSPRPQLRVEHIQQEWAGLDYGDRRHLVTRVWFLRVVPAYPQKQPHPRDYFGTVTEVVTVDGNHRTSVAADYWYNLDDDFRDRYHEAMQSLRYGTPAPYASAQAAGDEVCRMREQIIAEGERLRAERETEQEAYAQEEYERASRDTQSDAQAARR